MLTPDRDTVASLVQRILCAADRVEARLVLGEAVARLGFDGFCVGSSAPVGDSWALAPLITNWPLSDLEEYAARGYAQVDPTLPYLRRFHTPYFWDARRPPTAVSSPFFEFLARTTVRSGVVVPLGMSGERLWVFSASRSDYGDYDLAALDLLPLYGHAAKAAFGEQDRPATSTRSPLSVQQLAFLRLAADGKSSADIATITGHSRRTVDYHFSEILRKLNVATRAQAIMDLPLLDTISRSRR